MSEQTRIRGGDEADRASAGAPSSAGTLTIVTGSPGAGKTTLASGLARRTTRGLHIPADLFYAFPANPIDPTLPESSAQNEAIIRALGASAAVFLSAGYQVVLDGILGPWFLPVLLAEIPDEIDVDYVLLEVEGGSALARVRAREGRGASARVIATRASFAKARKLPGHVVETTNRTPEEVLETVCRRLHEGGFRWSR